MAMDRPTADWRGNDDAGPLLLGAREWRASAIGSADDAPTLRVEGVLELPTPGFTALLRPTAPSDAGSVLVLELLLTPPSGVVAQMIADEPVVFETPYEGQSAVAVACGDVAVASLPIEVDRTE